MCDFATSDVLVMARAIVEDPLTYVDGDFTPYYYCEFCDEILEGYYINLKDFKHDINCPVLIAHDILTRSSVCRPTNSGHLVQAD